MGTRREAAGFSVVVAAALAACGSDAPAAEAQTWMVDCVAVLGAPPPASETPLAAVPYSGARRDKRIGELTDDELGKFSDFEQCLSANGYRHDCCTGAYCPNIEPVDQPVAAFRLETIPLIAAVMDTCFATTAGGSGAPSREDSMALYRNYFAACHVGLWEDCSRELAIDPFGGWGWGPDCHEKDSLCTGP